MSVDIKERTTTIVIDGRTLDLQQSAPHRYSPYCRGMCCADEREVKRRVKHTSLETAPDWRGVREDQRAVSREEVPHGRR